MFSINVVRSNITLFDTRYSVIENRATMGQDESGPEFRVNFRSGRVGSFSFGSSWVRLRKLRQL